VSGERQREQRQITQREREILESDWKCFCVLKMMNSQQQSVRISFAVILMAVLFLLLMLASASAENIGYCETTNRFSGGTDCTQILSGGTVDNGKAACDAGLAMPGEAGTFTANARCPVYAIPSSFGGECKRETTEGLVIASVLELVEGSPFANCDGLSNVCTTFVQGEWLPSSACGGGGTSGEPQEPDDSVKQQKEDETGGDTETGSTSPALPAEVEILADTFQFTEGPVWIPATGADPSLPNNSLLFSDMRTNTMYTWSDKNGLKVYTNNSLGTNGKALDLDGNLISFRSGPRDVAKGALPETADVVADEFEGGRFNSPNDGAVNPMDGSIYFSDPIWGIFQRYEEGLQDMDVHGVYRISPEGEVMRELDALAMPNGIAVSPLGDVLFVSDTGGLPIHPNEKLRADGPPTLTAWALENGKVIEPPVPLWSREDYSDGMCINDKGLWSTRGGMGPSKYGPQGLVLTDPSNGKEIGHIPISEPTNVECNAEDGNIYVTASDKLVKVTLQ